MNLYYVILVDFQNNHTNIESVYDNEELAIVEASRIFHNYEEFKYVILRSEPNLCNAVLDFRIMKAVRSAMRGGNYEYLVKAYGFKHFLIQYEDTTSDSFEYEYAEIVESTAEEALKLFKATYVETYLPIAVYEKIKGAKQCI